MASSQQPAVSAGLPHPSPLIHRIPFWWLKRCRAGAPSAAFDQPPAAAGMMDSIQPSHSVQRTSKSPSSGPSLFTQLNYGIHLSKWQSHSSGDVSAPLVPRTATTYVRSIFAGLGLSRQTPETEVRAFRSVAYGISCRENPSYSKVPASWLSPPPINAMWGIFAPSDLPWITQPQIALWRSRLSYIQGTS